MTTHKRHTVCNGGILRVKALHHARWMVSSAAVQLFGLPARQRWRPTVANGRSCLAGKRQWHLTKPFCKSWLAEWPCSENDWFSVSDSRFFASRLWHVNSFLEAVIAYQTENRHDGCFCIKRQADHTRDSDTMGNIGTRQVQPLLLLVINIKEKGITDIRVRKS